MAHLLLNLRKNKTTPSLWMVIMEGYPGLFLNKVKCVEKKSIKVA